MVAFNRNLWPQSPESAAGYLEVPSDALDRIRKAQISGPVLWAPVIQVAA
ncbi:hypothetical protein ACVWZV_000053 [Bradyrhizobium sp. GM5.1]